MSKPTAAEFLDEFRHGLSRVWKSADLSKTKTYSLFELYVFKLVLQAAQSKGAYIKYKDGHGNEYRMPSFRTGPHQIYDPDYVYAELHFSPWRVLEVHTGVKFIGKSSVEHECDIAVIKRAAAKQYRKVRKTPHYFNILLAAECKFYLANIRLGMSRAFMGLTADLTAPKKRIFFVVSTKIVDNGKDLLEHHKKEARDEIVPSAHMKRDDLIKTFHSIF